MPTVSRMANRGVLWIVVAGALWASGDRWARRAAWRGLGSLAAASATANLVGKGLSARRRPDVDVPAARRLPRPSSPSFPSGHAANAAAFATGVAIEKPSLVAPAIALAAVVGASRIATGVHYPSDVLAGTAIGAAAGLMTLRWWPRRPADARHGDPAAPAGARRTGRGRPGPAGEHLSGNGVVEAGQLAGGRTAQGHGHRDGRWPGPVGAAAPGRGGSTDTRRGRRRRHGPYRVGDRPGNRLAAAGDSGRHVQPLRRRPGAPVRPRRRGRIAGRRGGAGRRRHRGGPAVRQYVEHRRVRGPRAREARTRGLPAGEVWAGARRRSSGSSRCCGAAARTS